jgi:hypothetical protein
MKYTFVNKMPALEMLVEELQKFLGPDGIDFGAIYPNFPAVRISEITPFAFLVDQKMNGTEVHQVNLFPSVTLAHTNERKPEGGDFPVLTENFKFTSAEMADIVANPKRYEIKPAAVSALAAATSAPGSYVWGKATATHRRFTLALDLWDAVHELKNVLYDIVMAWLTSDIRNTLDDTYNVKLWENQITGNKTGIYNYDFGRILYGAALTIPVDYPVQTIVVDTETLEVSEVIHLREDIHDE